MILHPSIIEKANGLKNYVLDERQELCSFLAYESAGRLIPRFYSRNIGNAFMEKKKNLSHGEIYIGYCLDSNIAVWDFENEVFVYPTKTSHKTIKHPEDYIKGSLFFVPAGTAIDCKGK